MLEYTTRYQKQNLAVTSICIFLWIYYVNCDEQPIKTEKETVDELVKKWAPLVWLAPNEKYLPGDVTSFLQHVHAEKSKTKTTKYMDTEEIDQYYYYDTENDELAALMNQENSNHNNNNNNKDNINYNNKNKWERRNKRNFKARNFLLDYIIDLPVGENSENWFLVTNNEIDKLLENKSSFLYGQNPSKNPIPIYAMVSLCSTKFKQTNDISNNIIQKFEKFAYKKNPYIPLNKQYDYYNSNNNYNNNNNNEPIQNNEIIKLNDRENNLDINLPKRMIKRSTIINDEYNNNNNNTSSYSNNTNVNVNETHLEQNNNDEAEEWNRKPISNFNDFLDKEIVENLNDKNEDKPININLSQPKIPEFHVTYWMFYPYSQGKAMCTLSLGPLGNLPIPQIFGFCIGTRKDFGSHVGDWEHMTLYFNGKMEPDEMYVSAHDAGAYYYYERLTGTFEFASQETRKGILQRPIFPRTVLTSNNHPVLFAAQGSHGLWTAPGKHRFVRVPRLYDVNGFGTPWSTWKSIEIAYENDFMGRSLTPSWLQYKGRWGNPKAKCHPLRRIGLHFCEISDGPQGIPMKSPHFYCEK